MRIALGSGALLLAASTVAAQNSTNITIPAVNGDIPAPGPNGCADGYMPGSSVVLFTVPYTYQQVLSVIGNYTNLTWSGSPPNSVTTNNSEALRTNDWTPGTSRTYNLDGAHIIETITLYEKPAAGPYREYHILAPLTVASANVSVYAALDAQVWQPICDGQAVAANFTAHFCATNVTTGEAVFNMLHSTDAVTVGKFLGGANFTSCAALNGTANASSTASGSASATAGVPTAINSPALTTTSGGASATSSAAAASSSSAAAGRLAAYGDAIAVVGGFAALAAFL